MTRAAPSNPRRFGPARIASWCAWCSLGAFPASAPGQASPAAGPVAAIDRTRPEAFVAIARDGRRIPCGWFVTLDDRLVALRPVPDGEAPQRTDLPLDELGVVLELEPNHRPMAMPGLLLTADGQHLPGTPRFASGQWFWRNRWTGEIEVPLERIAGLRFAPDGPLPTAVDGDVVELANGDRVVGLVSRIGTDVVVESDDGSEIRVPIERIRALRLVSPERPPTGPTVHFSDGTLAAGRIVADEARGGMRFEPTTPASPRAADRDRTSLRLGADDVRAYFPVAEAAIPLAALPSPRVEATGSFPSYAPPECVRSTRPGPGGADDLLLHGPGRFTWSLPPGRWMLVAEAVADRVDLAWTDFEAIVASDGRASWREGFGPDRRPEMSGPVPIAVDLDGGELRIELTEGERGPIADALRIRRAFLLRR